MKQLTSDIFNLAEKIKNQLEKETGLIIRKVNFSCQNSNKLGKYLDLTFFFISTKNMRPHDQMCKNFSVTEPVDELTYQRIIELAKIKIAALYEL